MDKINHLVISFGIALALQVIATAFLIDVNYIALDYKYYMRIPIAASNVIAAYLTPCLFLSYKYMGKNTLKKCIVLCILLIGIILTKSRGGILVGIITLIMYQLMIENKKKYLKKMGFILIGIIILLIALQNVKIQQILRGYSSGQQISLNSLSSGRLSIYLNELKRWLEHPILGNGVVYNESFTGAHNFLIDLLVQSGIGGFLLYIIPLVIIIKNMCNHLNNKCISGFFVFIAAILLHGLIEVNIFNYSTDIILWFICGAAMRKINMLNAEKKMIKKQVRQG